MAAVLEFWFDPQSVRRKRTSVALTSAVRDFAAAQLVPMAPGQEVVLVDEEGDRYSALVETVRVGAFDALVLPAGYGHFGSTSRPCRWFAHPARRR
jgi:hypothetical protein